jgi:hypothetical protein
MWYELSDYLLALCNFGNLPYNSALRRFPYRNNVQWLQWQGSVAACTAFTLSPSLAFMWPQLLLLKRKMNGTTWGTYCKRLRVL